MGQHLLASRDTALMEQTRPSCSLQGFISVQSLSRVQHFVTPWTAARQASLSITSFWSLLKLMSIESVMPSNHLCHSLLLPPSSLPNIRVFTNESVLRIRQPKYWSFSFSITPSNEYSGLISQLYKIVLHNDFQTAQLHLEDHVSGCLQTLFLHR